MRPRNPLTRRSAAGALDGTTPSGSARLDQVLAAATAPATEAELGREGAALTMFQQGPSARAHRASGVGLRARFASARIVVAGVVVALLAGSGVAIAAGVGPGDGIFNDPGETTRTGVPADPTARPTAVPSQAQDSQQVQSYSGLCRAFQAEALTNGNVAANPAYAALAEDAGGQGEIKQYCQELLGVKPTPGQPSALPTQAGDPTRPAVPTPTARPTSPVVPTPTVRPTEPPTPTADPTPTHPGGGKPTKPPKP